MVSFLLKRIICICLVICFIVLVGGCHFGLNLLCILGLCYVGGFYYIICQTMKNLGRWAFLFVLVVRFVAMPKRMRVIFLMIHPMVEEFGA